MGTVVLYTLAIIGAFSLLQNLATALAKRGLPLKTYRRITLHVTPECVHRLENMRVLGEKTKMSKVFQHALATYDCLLQEIAKGSKVLVRDEEGEEREVEIK